jgi:hypothetical protein
VELDAAAVLRSAPEARRQAATRMLISRLAAALELWNEPAVEVIVDALKRGFPRHELYAQAIEPLRLRLAMEPSQERRSRAAYAIELAVTPGHDLDDVFAHAQAALAADWPETCMTMVRMATE